MGVEEIISRFPDSLDNIMKRKGLNADELSRRCERSGHPIDSSLITRYLAGARGARTPTLKSLIALKQGLHCTLDELVGMAGPAAGADCDAERMWKRFQALPEGQDKDFIRARLLRE